MLISFFIPLQFIPWNSSVKTEKRCCTMCVVYIFNLPISVFNFLRYNELSLSHREFIIGKMHF